MYLPAHFREDRLDALHAHIEAHSFATLVSVLDGQLFATHLPLLLDPAASANGTLLGHVARGNPHWRAFGTRESLAIFQGPHAYVSPAWYVAQEAVPTWNYTVVHAYGAPQVMSEPERVRALLERMVGVFEAELPEPWSTARVPEDYVERMARGVVAFEMPIARLEGKRKLGQNRPADDVAGAAAGLRTRGEPLGLAVADLMLSADGG